ncbi:MAG: LytR/AlgR family response regulator transcription factor [Ekhidna sp.]
MKRLKILIVDDEPLAHKVLEGYCDKIESIVVSGNCYDGISALNFLKENNVDLLLLDIQMPDITGLELLDGLKGHTPKVIFTTAFTEYAIDGFNYDQVVDYLHKPIRFSRFIKAIERTQNTLVLERGLEESKGELSYIKENFILLKENKKVYKISFQDILYIQSWGNYLKFFLSDHSIKIVRKTLKEIEEELSSKYFQRIHKSYIINLNEITGIERNMAIMKNGELAIGKSYSVLLKKRFRQQ